MSINFAAKSAASAPADHTFLMNDGRWKLQGHWLLSRDEPCVPVRGKVMVVWNNDEWFSLVGKITRPSLANEAGDATDITLQYRGRIAGETQQQYTFVLQHSQYGQTEGEGWLMPDSILQRFWILGDRDQRFGVERFYRINDDRYYWSSSIMTGHALISSLEVTLDRSK
ncbi:hypothetical protein [Altericista sp. CCNU0014]|uniref:hypothetical protein n=1 Tax=Altericista sp. CCNU0014 TaxID=3082949 RepID=UPI003850BF45